MHIKNQRLPEQCTSMEEIRAEIDLLDRTVVSLIGQRYTYGLPQQSSKHRPPQYAPRSASRPCWHNGDSEPSKQA